MQRYFYWVVIGLVALFFIIFILKNGATVTLDLWPFEFQLQTRLSFLLIITFIVGVVVGRVGVWYIQWMKRLKAQDQHQAELKDHTKNQQ